MEEVCDGRGWLACLYRDRAGRRSSTFGLEENAKNEHGRVVGLVGRQVSGVVRLEVGT